MHTRVAGVARGIAALMTCACVADVAIGISLLILKLHVAMSVIMPMLLTPSKCIQFFINHTEALHQRCFSFFVVNMFIIV